MEGHLKMTREEPRALCTGKVGFGSEACQKRVVARAWTGRGSDATLLFGFDYIAAINGRMPIMFITRVNVYHPG
jgi:hypothetical protein